MTNQILVYAGTYTSQAPKEYGQNATGIYIYRFNPTTGQLAYLSETPIDNPSYLAIDSSRRYLFAVSEMAEAEKVAVTAYAIHPNTGALTIINRQPTFGSSSCYVSVDHTNRYVLVANYGTGDSVVLYPVQANGSIGAANCTIQHQGSGSVTARQERPMPITFFLIQRTDLCLWLILGLIN